MKNKNQLLGDDLNINYSNNYTSDNTAVLKTSYIKNSNSKDLIRSEIIINIDKETLLAFDDPEICTICFENKLNRENSTEFSCGHKFCKICIKAHLTTNIINGRVR